MATNKTAAPTANFVGVDALKHPDDKRRNIPTAEYQSLMADAILGDSLPVIASLAGRLARSSR